MSLGKALDRGWERIMNIGIGGALEAIGLLSQQ